MSFELQSAPIAQRYRKPTAYQRHYTNKLQCPLDSGDLILIEPRNDYGYYIVDPRFSPRVLPSKFVNTATRWGTPIPAMTSSGSPNPVEKQATEINVNDGELAFYKVIVEDPGVQMQIAQPSASFIFNDKAGARRLNQGNTLWNEVNGDYSAIPEIWVFQDDTPVTISTTSSNMNEDSFWARIKFLGWKWRLFKPRLRKDVDYPETVLTINVGSRQT